ncbi:hypothetical protein LTR28_009880 [Elasticomyces elasticus]|nr:hypothetical protein LTR28_009880 [Elasticomyces elasticus]
MEYAGSYALYNYRLADPSVGLDYSNLRLIRAFELGLDPQSSEAGFVLVHVNMVKHSGQLVSGSMAALDGCATSDRGAFDAGMVNVIDALIQVNRVMNKMWSKSKPGDYTSFRTFIFGITGQSMFPNGVVYEGIPLCDNLLQIDMPVTPLTDILTDFRAYRPGNHREFLEWVRDRSQAVGLKAYALQDPTSAALYLGALNQVRDFRWRHWCFTREYILKRTAHPTATGGSPIVTLQAVLTQMLEVSGRCGENAGVGEIVDLVRSQQETLKKEVEKYCADRGVA